MFISASTSDDLIVSSVCAFSADSGPIVGVESLDTDTMQVTLSGGAQLTCHDFCFSVSYDELDSIKTLIPSDLHDKILVGNKKAHMGKRFQSMVFPHNSGFLYTSDTLTQNMVTCSKCGTNFLVFRSRDCIYSAKFSSPDDIFPELINVADEPIVCSHCSASLILSF